MAEELNQSGRGVAEGGSDGTPGATADGAAERQPADSGQQQQQKINLDDLPEFRRVKSSYDQMIAQARRDAEEARRQADEIRMAQMDEQEKLAFQLEREREARERLQQQMHQMHMGTVRQRRIQEIHQETGVPLDALPTDAPNDEEIFKAAIRWLTTNGTAAAPSPGERAANDVDLGSGEARSASKDRDRKLQEALDSRDSMAYLRLILGQE